MSNSKQKMSGKKRKQEREKKRKKQEMLHMSQSKKNGKIYNLLPLTQFKKSL